MDNNIQNFVRENRIAVFAVLRKDGAPHAAALHMSAKDDVSEIYFFTEKKYWKSEALLAGKPVPATVVIGFSEADMRTLQMDGVAEMVGDSALPEVQKIHFGKIKKAEKYEHNPDMYFIRFIPAWWRYTVWEKDKEGKVVSKNSISSENMYGSNFLLKPKGDRQA
ncbi:pyridoxamine 5'-phosphate oxidase family protein [bacterium]|nr:pyridoxamine 5'-phosphate oxidase family protein [bacterium]